MKTKLTLPWNLRPGMRLLLESLPREVARDGAPREYTITNITKSRGRFTGATLWNVETSPAFGLPLSFAGKWGRFQKPEKAPVII